MCDVCGDLLNLLHSHDDRAPQGLQLNKSETIAVITFNQAWAQRQCMCCFKDFKNFERLNNIVQVILNVAIRIIQTLPQDTEKEQKISKQTEDEEKDNAKKTTEDSEEDKEKKKPTPEDVKDNEDKEKNEEKTEEEKKEKDDVEKKEEEKKEEEMESEDASEEFWSAEEKEKLLQFVAKVFLTNFPLYMAYKHSIQASLEELSQQEASALNNYCELSDPEVPVFLLRNVCFFCDTNGIHAMAQCFDKGTPDSLPLSVAHTLISILANLRLWMNIPTVMQYIVPLRTHVIRYMCLLSDKDLRTAGTRNMTDLMWTAVKEPIDPHISFDKEGLDLAFKYFTCSTLTIRLAGISQINNQINLHHDICNNENLTEADSIRIGNQLADWLIESKIIEHIFGPNLHVELIKQSQIILTFLAIEGRITNEHVDCVWAASQLKHCSKQVHDILIPLIKNMEIQPVQHLLQLVSSLEPVTHTEQTLYLASALIKFIWTTLAAAQSHVTTVQHPPSLHSASYTALQREHDEMEKVLVEGEKHAGSGSESSEGSHHHGSDEEEEEEAAERPAKRPYPQRGAGHHGTRGCRRKHRHHGDSFEEGYKVSEGGAESENSSLCANSEMSNISEESLPSDLSEGEVCSHQHLRKMHLRKHGEAMSGVSDSDIECTDSSEENCQQMAHQKQLQQRKSALRRVRHIYGPAARVPKCAHQEESSEEEEEEEEEYFDSEEEELMKHVVHEVQEEEESEESEYSGEEYQSCDHQTPPKNKPGRVKKTPPSSGEKHKKQSPKTPKTVVPPTGKDKDKTPEKTLEKEAKKKDDKEIKEKEVHDIKEKEEEEKKEAEKVKEVEEKTEKEEEKKKKEDTLEEIVVQESADKSKESEKAETDKGDKEKEREEGGAPTVELVAPSTSGETEATAEEKPMETEVYDCTDYIEHIHAHRHGRIQSDFIEDILSPDEASCNSSRISTKSEKNMADFEGEDVISDEEIAHINAHAHGHFSGHHIQQHLASMASIYQGHIPPGVLSHRQSVKESHQPDPGFNFEDVTKGGNTLLWDLVQEENAILLPEGLALEAEKALCSLVCFSTDKRIRTRFIEACVENVAHNRSAVVSLRLLPKILGSFQQYRSGMDTYTVTMWAERELQMMEHFFNNLTHYASPAHHAGSVGGVGHAPSALYSHREQIQVRLTFLTCVFSAMGSPEHFRLSLDQVDTLWNCLALDPLSSDDCLSWFLNQAKNTCKDHHALGLDTFKHIFTEKMPRLQPESISMIGLNLFQQLCHLARSANASLDSPLSEEEISGMDQLWGIALRARDTDVSLSAIQYLNNYYINYGSGVLEKEEEFIQRCMNSLVMASKNLDKNPESNLLVIQRGLILVTNHLESFRKRYAFHLRNWQLDNQGILSHQKSLQDKHSALIRIALQPAGSPEKVTLEMFSSDLVSELRAEVTRWWETLQKQQHLHKQQMVASAAAAAASSSGAGSTLTPILGAMLGDGPIRMITFGQELTVDMDEKTLAEMQFKDNQLVFVSVGASRQPRKHDCTLPASFLPAPQREKLPMMLLLQEPHFSHLFNLLTQLSSLECSEKKSDGNDLMSEQYCVETKASMLSKKVWELLMVLPTNHRMLAGFKSLTDENGDSTSLNWNTLLDPHSPHKLLYSLQIVESLSRLPKNRRRSVMRSGGGDYIPSTDSEMSIEGHELPEEVWNKKFVNGGGLRHLFNIFQSGSLQAPEGDHWSEWSQECLAYLLRLVSQFAITQADQEACYDEVFESNYESPRKKIKKQKSSGEKIIIPMLNQTTLKMVEVDAVMKILMSILYEVAVPGDRNSMGSWSSRAEVVHYAMALLVSWAYSCEEVQPALCDSENFSDWLKRLTLEAPEINVRHEACKGLYRLCLGRTMEGKKGYGYLLPLLGSLLSFLDDAQAMKPVRKERFDEKEKEPFGPGCRDYFWLVCRLVDSINKEDAKQSWELHNTVDIDSLAQQVAKYIQERDFFESRIYRNEDDGLIGLLYLCTAMIKHNPPFKFTQEGREFLLEIFWLLFALPSPEQRHFPKCKSQASRAACYDLMVEMVRASLENYSLLHEKVLQQHTKSSHSVYHWDHWPHEDGRSNCGYVGLTNLGATCYMATCMQHLYMIPQARKSILEAKCCGSVKYEGTLMELQKMFAYLMESERKAYNPRSFCKVYTMDKQPLNTGEQKDMTEFFTDLISKLEEMSPELKRLVKGLFGGVITNNVVSLDCNHVSRTKEEFYTVRCQVADMKNLYESLDEVTVKDTLEGDNMYTCSKCQKKVRAEKRACFRSLPKILCFNTMRYTFNMVTMMKEKVNTHFSFPLRLDMSGYMEKNLIQPDKLGDDEEKDPEEMADDDEDKDLHAEEEEEESFEYELIGVTVHTGTADGGHYYSFIRDHLNKTELGQDKWYLFNDAEVKPFDPMQIASECFGGEMTSKTYDSVTDKFMDFSFEKTNSAYMLFYERVKPERAVEEVQEVKELRKYNVELTLELNEWIWKDNMQFLQDQNIFEHTYFGFMWQMCGYIPTTLPKDDPQRVHLMSAKLGTSFVLETLIHSKEKPTMLQWIELLTKQFNSCHAACEWLLDHMAETDWWPQQILIKCPNQVVRQMFQRLLIHVISQLKPVHQDWYLHPLSDSEDEDIDPALIGNKSCVTRFIKRMLYIIEQNSKPNSKHMTEYFAFLLEFAKMGDDECHFLIQVQAISTMVNFYMGHRTVDNYVEILSDDEEEEENDVIALEEKYRPQSLEKMIALIALLVEKSRGEDRHLQISERDFNSIVGGKGFPFLFNQIRDHINIRQTCNLIFSLCRWNERLAVAIIQMIFTSVMKLNHEGAQPFFKLLSMLVEFVGGPPGMPPFTQYVLQKFWEVAEYCPQQCLEWLSSQVIKNNKIAHAWVLQHMDTWVEPYLLAHTNVRVRNAAAYLLVSLVPSNHFRQAFRSARSILSPHKEISMSSEAVNVLHEVYGHLLELLPRARDYVDAATHGTMKLMSYFALLTYCLVSKTEKLMFTRYFMDLWQLFQPKLSEPPISMHHNKQALLIFWYQVCVDCPDNVKLIVNTPHVAKNIAFNYILADHDDQDVVLFNRCMLPAYYGILRMCCQQARAFTRQLAQHQNIQWAFKNITPYPAQYTAAVDELFKMMKLMSSGPESSDEEMQQVRNFRRNTIQLYLQNLDARSNWQTLTTALKILVDVNEDRLQVIQQQGLPMLAEAFNTLHVMYHEATACHVTGDIVDLLALVASVIRIARHYTERRVTDVRAYCNQWKDRMDFMRKLLTLLNSYTPPDIRSIAIETLREMIMMFQSESLATMVPYLTNAHSAFQDSSVPEAVPFSVAVGPYFPKRGQKPISSKANIRPPRPQFQMFLHTNQLEAAKGVDEAYDAALTEFFFPYHTFIDLLFRVAVNQQDITEQIVNLSAMVAYEGVPLHSPYFAKLWYEIYQAEHVDKNCMALLCSSSYFIDYVDAVLLDERQSLNHPIIYQFFCNYFPKVFQQVLSDQGQSLLDSLVASITAEQSTLENFSSEKDLMLALQRVNGDLRALLLIFSVQPPKQLSELLEESLNSILEKCKHQQQRRVKKPTSGTPAGVVEDEEEEGQREKEKTEKATEDKEEMQEKERKEDSEESDHATPSKRRRISCDEEEKKGAMAEESEVVEVEKETGEKTKSSKVRQEPEPKPSTSYGDPDSVVPETEEDEEEKDMEQDAKPTTDDKDSGSDEADEKDDAQSGKGSPVAKQSRSDSRLSTREKPTIIDMVVRNIETIFGMITKVT